MLCYIGILIHQLDFYDSVIDSVAPSQYILLCLQSFRVYDGPISSASHTPHCHMSTMGVLCISEVFDCSYGDKMFLTWLDYTGTKVYNKQNFYDSNYYHGKATFTGVLRDQKSSVPFVWWQSCYFSRDNITMKITTLQSSVIYVIV